MTRRLKPRAPQTAPFALRVVKHGFVPADMATHDACKANRFQVGQLVIGHIEQPRNPKLFRLAHVFAREVKDNIERFAYFSEHQVLKQLQAESGVGCEPVSVPASAMIDALSQAVRDLAGDHAAQTLEPLYALLGDRVLAAKRPRSLSFGNMSESEFCDMFIGFARYLCDTDATTLRPEQFTAISATMPTDA